MSKTKKKKNNVGLDWDTFEKTGSFGNDTSSITTSKNNVGLDWDTFERTGSFDGNLSSYDKFVNAGKKYNAISDRKQLHNEFMKLKDENEIENMEDETQKNDNIFLKGAKWIKDAGVSIPASMYENIKGVKQSATEGFKERKEALDNMSNEELVQLSGKNSIDDVTGLTKAKLFLQDVAQDTGRGVENGIVSMGNTIADFFSGNKDPEQSFFKKSEDNSVLKNSEQYGDYHSKEELKQHLQEQKKADYETLGITNPSANAVGDVAGSILALWLMAGDSKISTGNIVGLSAFSTYGETGNVEDTTKSVVQAYVFSKILDSQIVNGTQSTTLRESGKATGGATTFKELGIKGKVTQKTAEILAGIKSSHPSLFNGRVSNAIYTVLPDMNGTFVAVGTSRFAANELTSIMNQGRDTFNSDTQKKIIADSFLWAGFSAAVAGYDKIRITKEQSKIAGSTLNADELKQQINEWYSTMELDPNREYSVDEINTQYKNLAKKYHPDITKDNGAKMTTINQVHDALVDYKTTGKITKINITVEPTNEPTNNMNTQNGIILEDNGDIYVDTDMIVNSVAESIVNEKAQPAIQTILDKDGEVIGFEKVQAIYFDVENSKLENVKPALVMGNENQINVIDLNSGTLLLSNAKDVNTAVQVTTEALQSEDMAKIQNINEQINKNQYKVSNAMEQLVSIIREKASKVNIQNTFQNVQNKNTDIFGSETINYAVDDIEGLKNEFNAQEIYTIDELADVWNNTHEKEMTASYDENNNLKSYIAIEETKNGLVVNQYDNQDNLLKSEEIPQTNGQYKAVDIQNTIERVSQMGNTLSAENVKNDTNIGIKNVIDNNVEKTDKAKSGNLESSNIAKSGNMVYNEVDSTTRDNVKDIKKRLRNTKLNVSSIKNSIPDYNDFRKSNYGKLKLGNDGVDVDTFYKELVNDYPEYFDNNIINPIDQLQEIADWINIRADKLLEPVEVENRDGGKEDEIRRERNRESNENATWLSKEKEYPYTESGFREQEKRAKENQTRELSTEQQQIKSKYEKKIGKEIRFFDGDENDIPAFASQKEKDVIYINSNTYKEYDIDKLIYHEVLESEITHNEKIRQIATKAEYAILKDENFENQIKEFYKEKEVTTDNPIWIAKDIICDMYAKYITGDELDYENVLDLETNMIIDDSISKIDKIIQSNIVLKSKSNSNIKDFGKKIGGARKDIAMPRENTTKNKEVVHDYIVQESNNGYAVNFRKRILKDGFKTQEEAEKYIIYFKENIKSNLAYVEEETDRNGEKKYIIRIRNSRTLKAIYTHKVFSNKQDAESYAIALSMYLKEHGKNLFRPEIQKVERNNPNNHNATKTTGEDILDNFKFKGGEFGNWVTQSERQEFLNYAQNAFTDLAIALDIDNRDLGQNGEMNIAFGARGKGLSGAVAHFEPAKRVINMTRLKGAGSLAHEYGHSIDNWLSRLSGYADNGMATTNSRNPKLSDRMQQAIKNVVDSMKYNISTNQGEINRKNAIYEKNRKENLEYNLQYLDKVFTGKATRYKRIKGKYESIPIIVTEDQEEEYQKIRNILMKGQLEGETKYEFENTGKDLKGHTVFPEPIDKLQKMYKKVVGRKLEEDKVWSIYRQGKPAKQITEVKSESAYLKSAYELDKMTGRSSAYFATVEEMWARAFEAYISDKLKAKGITDTYLVHSVNNNDYALFNPFPAGEERQNINRAFDNLIQIMKENGILHTRKLDIKDTGSSENVHYLRKSANKQADKSVPKFAKKPKSTIKKPPQNKGKQEIDNIEKSKTNGERDTAYIEQERQRVEKTGKFDNSIKGISTRDIVEYINKFFEDNIQKGHFRQRAYALYKEDRDIIRTQSINDIDSIIHEVFHRLFKYYNIQEHVDDIYLEVVTDDILELYKNLKNQTDIANEGWAEFGRLFIAKPEEAKRSMPDTVKVLQDRMKQYPELNKFIIELQKKVHDFIYQNPYEYAQARVSRVPKNTKLPFKQKLHETKRNFITQVLNQDYILEEMTDWLVQNGLQYVNSYQLPIEKNPVVINSLKNGLNDKIDSILKNGIYDLKTGKKICDGLEKIGEILTTAKDVENFEVYLVASRVKEIAEKGKISGFRYNDALAIVKQFENNPKIKKATKIYQDFNNALLDQAVEAGLYSIDDVKKMRNAWINYAPVYRVMDDLNDGGKTSSKDPIKKFKGSEREIINPLEGTIIFTSRLYSAIARNDTIKAFIDLGESVSLGGQFYDIIPTPVKHLATEYLSNFAQELEAQGIDISELDLDKVHELYFLDRKDNPQERIISYKDKGKTVTLQFKNDKDSTELFNFFYGTHSAEVPNVLAKFFKGSANVFRYGTTILNRNFVLNNMISDTQSATVKSKGDFKPFYSTAKGIADVIIAGGIDIPTDVRAKLPDNVKKMIKNFEQDKKYVQKTKELYYLYQQSGGSGATRTSEYSGRKNTSKKVADYLQKNYKSLGLQGHKFKDAIQIASILSDLSEEATRFENFILTINKLNSNSTGRFYRNLMNSAYNTRNVTQDFATGGKLTKGISPYRPYLSSKIGSIENTRIFGKEQLGEAKNAYQEAYEKALFEGKSEEESKQKGKEAFAKSISKMIIMSSLLITSHLLLDTLNRKDKEYEEINKQTRYNNSFIHIGDKWIKIKKPQGDMRVLTNTAIFLMNLFQGNYDDNEWKEFTDLMKNTVADTGVSDDIISIFPPLVQTSIEITSNHDSFYDDTIVPQYMMDTLEPKDWYNENTTELSKLIGGKLNVKYFSPIQLDYIIKHVGRTSSL